MRRVLASLVAVAVLTVAGGAEPTRTTPKAQSRKAPQDKPYQVGKASWYGKRFHGRTTASGEAFNMYQFTAAHRQLPLGTWVKVTNLRNRKWIMVRVNDRGPLPDTRIIDLSYATAQLLGFRERGTERVRLDIVKPESMAATRDLIGLEQKPVN